MNKYYPIRFAKERRCFFKVSSFAGLRSYLVDFFLAYTMEMWMYSLRVKNASCQKFYYRIAEWGNSKLCMELMIKAPSEA